MSVVRQGVLSVRDRAHADLPAMAVRFALMGLLILAYSVYGNSSQFFRRETLQLLAFDAIPSGLLAMGLALVMVASIIDLSLAANFSLCVVVIGWMMANGHGAGESIVVSLLISVCAGVFNGVLIGRMGLPAVTTTLGSLATMSGIALAIGNGQFIEVNFFPDLFTGGFGIILAILMVLLAAVLWIFLSTSSFGASVTDPSTRVDAGAPTGTVERPELVPLFCGAAVLAAGAAMVELGRTQVADPNFGSSLLITALAAAAVGGVGLFRGGPLTIPGAAIGALLVSCVNTELILANVGYGGQQFAMGAIILVSLISDRLLAFLVAS